MRKSSIVSWSIITLICLALICTSCIFLFVPAYRGWIYTGTAGLTYDTDTLTFTGAQVIEDVSLGTWCMAFVNEIISLFTALFTGTMFSSLGAYEMIFIAIVGVIALLIILNIVCFIRSKKASMFLWLLGDVVLCIVLIAITIFIRAYHGSPAQGTAFINESYAYEIFTTESMPILMQIFVVLLLFGLVLGLISVVVLIVLVPVYALLNPKEKKQVVIESEPEPAPVADPVPPAPVQEVPVYAGGGDSSVNNINTVGSTSPLVVQYFNNYGPCGPDGGFRRPPQPCECEEERERGPKCECLSKEEVKEIVDERLDELVGGKFNADEFDVVYETEDGEEVEYVDFDDIRKLIKDEVKTSIDDLAPVRTEPVKEEIILDKPTEVTKAAVEDTIEEPTVATTTVTSEKVEVKTVAPIVVAVPAQAVEEDITEVSKEETTDITVTDELTEDDIRSLVGEELRQVLKEIPSPVKKKVTHKVITKEVPTTETVTVTEKVSTQEETPVEKTVIEITKSDSGVKETVVEETIVTKTTEPETVQETVVKETIVEETKVEEPVVEEPVVEETTEPELAKDEIIVQMPSEDVVEEKVEEKVEEVIEEPVVVKVERPVEAVEEDITEPEPEEEKRPLIPQPEIRGKEATIEKGEVVNLNFLERIATGSDLLKENYNSIKGTLMSYGLKDRLSNTGDTFKLAKATYAKITCLGDSLKIYLALDPKDYVSTSIPVQDVSKKSAYKEIPLAFKVHSELSLRRANELIQSCMLRHHLEAKEDFVPIDYAEEVKNVLAEKQQAK